MAATDFENRAAAVLQSNRIDGFPDRSVLTADVLVIGKRHVVPLLFMDDVPLPLLMRDESRNSRRPHVIGCGACRTHDVSSGEYQSRLAALHTAKQRQQVCIHWNYSGMKSTRRQA